MCGLETSSKPFCVYKELSLTTIKKKTLLKQADYTGYIIAILSKHVKISLKTSLDSFYRGFFTKMDRELVSRPYFL